MHFTNILALALLSYTASAQTGAGFPVDAVDTLELVFQNETVNPSGELIPRAITANPPTIYSPVFPSNGTGIIIMVDQDVPVDQTNPLNSVRVSLVHWLAPGVTMPNSSSSLQITNPSGPPGITYLQPTPPPGDIAHRYNVLLFSQPNGFTIPAPWNNITTTDQRYDFNISAFIAETGLAQPLAANYFEVQQYLNNTNGTSTASSTASATGSSTKSAAIAPYSVPIAETVWALLATTLFTVFA